MRAWAEASAITVPVPDCHLGYTAAQTVAIMGEDFKEFRAWADGETPGVCSSPADDYQPCPVAYGLADYVGDVERFLRRC